MESLRRMEYTCIRKRRSSSSRVQRAALQGHAGCAFSDPGWTEVHLLTICLCINRQEALIPREARGSPGLPTGYEAVGGLDRHIAQIRELVELPLTRPDLYAHFGLSAPRGILLHGPPGTGKTLLASSIAASLRLPLISIDGPGLSSPFHGETEQRLRDVFAEAQACAPSIIVIDEVDALVPAREDAGEVERRVVATLLTLMDGLGGKEPSISSSSVASPSSSMDGSGAGAGAGEGQNEGRVIVIAATNRPNAIDQALRRPGRFDKELEIGVPDAEARLSILRVLLRRTPHALDDALLHEIAGKTHGYVGADLSSLIHTAGLNAIRRITAPAPQPISLLLEAADRQSQGSAPDEPSGADAGVGHSGCNAGACASASPSTTSCPLALDGQKLLPADLEVALLSTRPSALRSVFLETPQVAWSDIGGQSVVKQKLQEVIEWPLRHPETFKRLGVRPPRGILLYGPPGCSKTLIARALASGAGVNFIAVKGPEVCSSSLCGARGGHSLTIDGITCLLVPRPRRTRSSTSTSASPSAPCARHSGKHALRRRVSSSWTRLT